MMTAVEVAAWDGISAGGGTRVGLRPLPREGWAAAAAAASGKGTDEGGRKKSMRSSVYGEVGTVVGLVTLDEPPETVRWRDESVGDASGEGDVGEGAVKRVVRTIAASAWGEMGTVTASGGSSQMADMEIEAIGDAPLCVTGARASRRTANASRGGAVVAAGFGAAESTAKAAIACGGGMNIGSA